MGECVIFSVLCGSLGKSLLNGRISSSKSKHDSIGFAKYSLSFSDCFDLLRCRSDLAFHVLGDTSCFSRSIIVRTELSIPKDFESWIASHLKPTTGVFASFGTIHLD